MKYIVTATFFIFDKKGNAKAIPAGTVLTSKQYEALTDMKKAKLIDKIIKEPLGGAHYDSQQVFDSVQDEVLKTFKVLDKLEPLELIKNRRAKLNDMGVFKD